MIRPDADQACEERVVLRRMRRSPSFFLWLLQCCVALLIPNGICGARQLLVAHADVFFPPYEMVEGEQVRGVHIDVVQAADDKLGISLAFRSYPWNRAMMMLQRGEADAITYMGRTPAREQYGVFVEGNLLSRTHHGFLALKD